MSALSTPKLNREELTEVLLAVVRSLRIAESRFRAAASVATDARIRRTLLERARTWARAARELTAVAAIEWAAANVAHAGARVVRACRPEAAPLAECASCEEAVALRYRDALDHPLPEEVERVLIRQFSEVLRHFGALHRLLDQPAGGAGLSATPV